MDPEQLADVAITIFGEDRVQVRGFLPDAVEAAIELAEENLDEAEGMSGTGVVITGSVVTAGAARTLFGKDPA
jgi:dihydrofolate synthase/folylpolyglutamate synthase